MDKMIQFLSFGPVGIGKYSYEEISDEECYRNLKQSVEEDDDRIIAFQQFGVIEFHDQQYHKNGYLRTDEDNTGPPHVEETSADHQEKEIRDDTVGTAP